MLNKNLMPRPKRRAPEPPPPPEQQIEVQGDHITLGQLLKVAGIISTGGEAKLYLADIVVMVNGEPEQRRGRKLRVGDLIAAPAAPPIRLVAPPSLVPEGLARQNHAAPTSSHVKNKPGGDVNGASKTSTTLTSVASASNAPGGNVPSAVASISSSDTRKEPPR